MEHHPYITLSDDTKITYSDIKTDERGNEYVTVYFETPVQSGFHSMQVDYPKGIPEKIVGYSEQDVNMLMRHYDKVGHNAFEFAKEK